MLHLQWLRPHVLPVPTKTKVVTRFYRQGLNDVSQSFLRAGGETDDGSEWSNRWAEPGGFEFERVVSRFRVDGAGPNSLNDYFSETGQLVIPCGNGILVTLPDMSGGVS